MIHSISPYLKNYIIDKYKYSNYNHQSLDLKKKISCVGNEELFYFTDDRKYI